MSVTTPAPPAGDKAADGARAGRVTRPAAHALRGVGLAVSVVVLVFVLLLSVWLGSKDIPFLATWDVLWHNTGSQDSLIIHAYRIPRTLLGIVVGGALGLAGALMQALTRNPLADPGILGVTMGASSGVVVGLVFFGVGSVLGQIWFALAGAAIIAAVVYTLGSSGKRNATPERLVLAGAAVTAVLFASCQALLLTHPDAYNSYRYWNVGSLTGRGYDVLWPVLPFVVAGIVLTFLLVRPLNALAMGDELAGALGAHPGRVRVVGALAATLLCGAATAAAGPIAFVGLAIPHVARLLVGPDQRWVLPYSLVFAPILLVGADVVGRVVAPPSEIQVAIVTAVIGVPVFIALCRKRKLSTL